MTTYLEAGIASGWTSGFLSGYSGTMLGSVQNSGAITLRLCALSGAEHRGQVVTIHYVDGAMRVSSVLGDFIIGEDGAQVPVSGHIDVAALALVLAEAYNFDKV